MILQALADYYDVLQDKGLIPPLGWEMIGVSFALDIGADGILKQIVSLEAPRRRGTKEVLAPVAKKLPSHLERTSGVVANFLCHNSAYMLGIDAKEKSQRALKCFKASRDLHRKLLDGVESPCAKAVLNFFDKWDSSKRHHLLETDPNLKAYYDSYEVYIRKLNDFNSVDGPNEGAKKPEPPKFPYDGKNFVFMFDGMWAQEDPALAEAWNKRHLDLRNSNGDGTESVCLVTGKIGPISETHPRIKNVRGSQSSGAALVSFNEPAFCSYGKKQNLNAPVGSQSAMKYTVALNHLLGDDSHKFFVGDTTVVFWARNGEPAYQDAVFGSLNPDGTYSEEDLGKMLRSLGKGGMIDFNQEQLDPDMQFFILGLSPNAGRISVRFFIRDSFGAFLDNIRKHYDRLEIIAPKYDKHQYLSPWQLLQETVNNKADNPQPAPGLAGELLRSVLSDTRYPATLLNGVALRIRAEQNVTRGRAAILKAYYLKNTDEKLSPEEVLTVSLSPNSHSVPYTLGRMFSVLEMIQEDANRPIKIKTTIRDRYFNSASSTPAHVFPTLMNLAQKHLKKLENGKRIYYENQLLDLMSVLGESYPVRMSLPEQGAFQLGYYHQTQSRYTKKEDKENV